MFERRFLPTSCARRTFHAQNGFKPTTLEGPFPSCAVQKTIAFADWAENCRLGRLCSVSLELSHAFWITFSLSFSSFFKNVLPAKVESMIFKIDPQQFASKMLHFWAMMPLIPSGWNHLFDRFRSCVRSVRFLSPKVSFKRCRKSVYYYYRGPLCGFRWHI